ncbi:DUF397 domain-containing protein [Saccharopolyspora sp. NPDC050389]|uniref:DUF397 domain-containing protein n=1 Tax=Saccharopolyspora sp. NPDC050389 TaxID=3155516 RepID=UPI0033FE6DBD
MFLLQPGCFRLFDQTDVPEPWRLSAVGKNDHPLRFHCSNGHRGCLEGQDRGERLADRGHEPHRGKEVLWRGARTGPQGLTVFTNWRKSAKSLHNPEQCVEIGTAPGKAGVRDTKNRDGALLTFPAVTWAAFLSQVKAGKFDR